MAKKLVHSPLSVTAIDGANVRDVEPDGSIVHDLRFVGKQFNASTQEFEVIPGGVLIPYSAHIVNQLKQKTLLPSNQYTANAAGVDFSG